MRNRAALVFAIALAALASVTASRADEWPSRPIRAIIPLSPGSAADVVPRIVFEQLSAQLGQPIIVENKPGASGTIAARAVAMADPRRLHAAGAFLGSHHRAFYRDEPAV